MAQTADQCRKCRREGRKLFLKGERCNSQKCAFFRRGYAPGEHGVSSARKKISEYGVQLREKQEVKRIYGVSEAQFRNYYQKAEKRQGITGENLLITLELRLDNVVHHMGFAPNRITARQLIGHGHFTVNGKKVDIPSYLVKVGEKIEVKDTSKKNEYFSQVKESEKNDTPEWLVADLAKLKGEVKSLPTRENIDPEIQEQLIVELYSK